MFKGLHFGFMDVFAILSVYRDLNVCVFKLHKRSTLCVV